MFDRHFCQFQFQFSPQILSSELFSMVHFFHHHAPPQSFIKKLIKTRCSVFMAACISTKLSRDKSSVPIHKRKQYRNKQHLTVLSLSLYRKVADWMSPFLYCNVTSEDFFSGAFLTSNMALIRRLGYHALNR